MFYTHDGVVFIQSQNDWCQLKYIKGEHFFELGKYIIIIHIK